MTNGRNTKTASKRGHIQIPHRVMDTNDYRNLPPNAIKLLNALVYQYRGRNNGDLTAAYTYMQQFGFKSKATLHRARKQLLEAKMIIQTRQGFFMNPGGRCALYALTWLPVDDCQGKKLEVRASITPPRKFSMEQNK
jgi:hypothetical protein